MVLNDVLIREYCQAGMVTPFTTERVNPASIDLVWSGRYRYPALYWQQATEEMLLADVEHYTNNPDAYSDIMRSCFGQLVETDFIYLMPGDLILADTLEYITMPQNLAGTLMLKSSLGRVGLEHLHAGWFDPGFSGTATLELKNVAPWPVLLKKGQPIVQLIFYECYPPAVGYDQTGSYNGQSSPQPAK